MSILATLTGECESLSDNPCVGWCTTRQFGDDRCKACYGNNMPFAHRFEGNNKLMLRLENEIKQWGEYTILEKKLINIRNAGEGFTIKQCVPTGWRPNIKPQVYKEKI